MNASLSNRFWLGIDLAQQSFDAALAPVASPPVDWRKLPVHSFANDARGLKQLRVWLRAQLPASAQLHGICLESTGGLSRQFAERLAALDPALPAAAIVNPKRSLDFARSLGLRDKSDRIDGAILALFGATFQPDGTPELSDTQRRLRELVRVRETLLKTRDALANQLREDHEPFVRKLLARRRQQATRDLAALAAEALRLIREDPATLRDYRLLLSIKGIGPIIAWTILAELGDLRRFSRNELIAYVGLYPRLQQSGKVTWKRPGLAKGGHRLLRKVLYNGARSLLRSKDNSLKDYADRLQERGETPMYCITATMRKLLLVARAVIVSGTPYDPEFNS